MFSMRGNVLHKTTHNIPLIKRFKSCKGSLKVKHNYDSLEVLKLKFSSIWSSAEIIFLDGARNSRKDNGIVNEIMVRVTFLFCKCNVTGKNYETVT